MQGKSETLYVLQVSIKADTRQIRVKFDRFAIILTNLYFLRTGYVAKRPSSTFESTQLSFGRGNAIISMAFVLT
jgi:hypothetical protein